MEPLAPECVVIGTLAFEILRHLSLLVFDRYIVVSRVVVCDFCAILDKDLHIDRHRVNCSTVSPPR